MTETAAAPRLIRRYSNRKLYDVRTSAYVALDDLAAMVRAGEELRVVDTATGDDITAQTLTQVILEEGKRGPSLLPTELLHTALRRGGRAVDTLRHGVDDLVQGSIGRLGNLARALPGGRADELDALRQQVAQMERTLAALVARQPDAAAAANAAPPHPSPEPAAR